MAIKTTKKFFWRVWGFSTKIFTSENFPLYGIMNSNCYRTFYNRIVEFSLVQILLQTLQKNFPWFLLLCCWPAGLTTVYKSCNVTMSCCWHNIILNMQSPLLKFIAPLTYYSDLTTQLTSTIPSSHEVPVFCCTFITSSRSSLIRTTSPIS